MSSIIQKTTVELVPGDVVIKHERIGDYRFILISVQSLLPVDATRLRLWGQPKPGYRAVTAANVGEFPLDYLHDVEVD